MIVTLDSPSYLSPPNFTLSFNVSFGPPTNVNCSVDNDNVTMTRIANEVIKHEYEDGDPDVTRISLIVLNGGPGMYKCMVRNRESDTSMMSVLNLKGGASCLPIFMIKFSYFTI